MSGDSSKTTYAPFEKPAAPPADAGGGAAMGLGLAVVVCMMFVLVTILRGLLTSLEAVANPPPPEPPPPVAQAPAEHETSIALSLLRPRGEIVESAEEVDAGLFSDTVTFTGRVRNNGAGGKVVVRVRAEYEDAGRPAVTGEREFTIINAGSSEPYRIELKLDKVARHPPKYVHEVFIP